MAAAAFTGTLKFMLYSKGQAVPYTQRVTISDVNAAFYIFQDGSSDITLPSDCDYVSLVDVILVTGGTDTTSATIFANQRETGEIIDNKSNLTTNQSRQYMGSPVNFKPGARLKFRQNT